MIKDLVLLNRSYRKFHNSKKVYENQLTELVDLARTTPSSKNRQPLKYLLVTIPENVDFVFSHLKWAWFLKNWNGPEKSEQAPAYIIMLLDKDLNDQAYIDAGIAAQIILLGAAEKKLGGCIIRTVNTYALSNHFKLPNNLDIIQVIAIGHPNQKVELTTIGNNESVDYYEGDDGIHYVPKRKLEDIIIPSSHK